MPWLKKFVDAHVTASRRVQKSLRNKESVEGREKIKKVNSLTGI
jgi:hypothetical protein